MRQWNKLLKSLGFNESEVGIYLASLEIGSASVQDLAKKAKVSRVTAYNAIESLSGRNLMSSVEKGKKKLFVAESPERIVPFVHTRIKEMEATLHEVQHGLNDLKLLQRGEKPVVRLFEGRDALNVIQEDVLASKTKYYEEFGNFDDILRLYPPEGREEYFKAIGKLRPKARSVWLARIRPPVSTVPGQKYAFVPKSYDFSGDVFIYSNKVALSTLKGKQIAVIIESEELVKTMRALFDFLWLHIDQKIEKQSL